MAELVVERRHLDAARLAGACEIVDLLPVGTPIEDVEQAYLIWFAERCPDLTREIEEAAQLPIWALSGSGSGSGDGYGSGYWYGSGSGDGT